LEKVVGILKTVGIQVMAIVKGLDHDSVQFHNPKGRSCKMDPTETMASCGTVMVILAGIFVILMIIRHIITGGSFVTATFCGRMFCMRIQTLQYTAHVQKEQAGRQYDRDPSHWRYNYNEIKSNFV